MRGFRRILVALDGSQEVLTPGLQLAGDEGCWTTVLKVLPANEGDLELTGIKDIDAVLAGGDRQVRADVRQSAEAARVLVKARIEEGGIPERIVAVAAEERCDLIVIGRERLPWYRRLLGPSIAERVARSAQCPVLVL
jgi:nucleotide-binding universal stress UspA family protein